MTCSTRVPPGEKICSLLRKECGPAPKPSLMVKKGTEKVLVDVDVCWGAVPRHGGVGVVVVVVGEEGVGRVERAGGRKFTDASLHWMLL